MSEENKHEWSIHKKLAYIQTNLKAKKSRFNKFAEFWYRNLEDILEAAKPINDEIGAYLLAKETFSIIGTEVYCECTYSIVDIATGDSLSANGFAREEKQRPKMSPSQLSGSASSFAAKYALNRLFAIDDTKDPDEQDNRPESQNQAQNKQDEVQAWRNLLLKDLKEFKAMSLFDPNEIELIRSAIERASDEDWKYLHNMRLNAQDRSKELAKQSKQEG